MYARTLSVRVLTEVLQRGRSLDRSLGAIEHLDRRDQAFARELCYGVLRWLPRLRFQLGLLLNKPLKSGAVEIECLLLAGLYQILQLRTPDHAAVSASVDCARDLGKPWAGKLVNAVLRRASRERAQLESQTAADAIARHAHPAWWLQRLQQDWPEDWQNIVEANNARPPLCIRVNQRLTGVENYRAQLLSAGFEAQPHPYSPQALLITPTAAAEQLPGFREGLVSVQDAAAQLTVPMLDLAPGQCVLDACAAPGGKTAHILEAAPTLSALVAVDISAVRLQRLAEGLTRLRLSTTLLQGDAAVPADWWDGRHFDRILLDAPCSGSGVIRRHPDIKYRRDTAAVTAAAALQRQLLDSLWPLLARGGKLLYATCSILPEENDHLIAAWLEQQTDAVSQPIQADWGRATSTGRQILPGDADMDGFFYACLNKT